MAFKRYLILKYILIIKTVAKVQNILESLSSVKRINMQLCFHSRTDRPTILYSIYFYTKMLCVSIPK